MKKVLVANRGEIALRILRSLREMGITSVAVFSEADRTAPFVRYADEAVCVGPPASAKSYLREDKIIEVAQSLNVDGIHPGYGFLSENASFARKVEKAGITFIGPSPEAIEVMGDKLSAKAAVKSYDIPLVPGVDDAITDVKRAAQIAEDIGFPVLIKASAGGGGKGMRIVENRGEFESQMDRAVSEAVSAFGNGAVFIEKYVASPRHVEIQVLADTHGNVLHLFERECSIQRRHQKVIEEAPSTVLTPELRAKMGSSACDVARACNYVGAGTVEFLVDADLNYYFLEMNTRLQVEHPVTEMITGKDLVKEQVNIARGETLSFSQEDLKINGHSIEVRVYAEDPSNNFLPDIGQLTTYRPAVGPGVRIDDGFEEGMEIPIHYDPMIAKLVVHGATRDEALARMRRAIADYEITGVATTLSFCLFVMNHPAFISGDFDTHFVATHFSPEKLIQKNPEEIEMAALVAAIVKQTSKKVQRTTSETAVTSNWRRNRS